MPEFWTKRVFNLPRWAWAGMIAGGIGVGLYLRHRNGAAGEEAEEEGAEGYLNSGQLMPPGAPIEGGGGGGGTVYVPKSESSKPEVIAPIEEPHSEPEIPESPAPEEPAVEQPGSPPFVENAPITVPVGPQPVPGSNPHEGISTNQPAPAPPPPIAPNIPVAPPSNQQQHEKARREIDRLQGEIDGLQNHIAQLTNVIQQYPKAKQRGQWEAERNGDRTNIEGKRNEVIWWSAQL